MGYIKGTLKNGNSVIPNSRPIPHRQTKLLVFNSMYFKMVV